MNNKNWKIDKTREIPRNSRQNFINSREFPPGMLGSAIPGNSQTGIPGGLDATSLIRIIKDYSNRQQKLSPFSALTVLFVNKLNIKYSLIVSTFVVCLSVVCRL